VLNASHNNLEQVPVPVCTLPRLRSLDVSNNNIRFLPPQVADSSSLTSLSLHANDLRQLPSSLASLARSVSHVPCEFCSHALFRPALHLCYISLCLFSLRVLTVYGNPISALPEALLSHAAQAGWCGASVPLPALTVESGLAIHVSAPS
jgi:Leucine-rich repeat (LRR) protein